MVKSSGETFDNSAQINDAVYPIRLKIKANCLCISRPLSFNAGLRKWYNTIIDWQRRCIDMKKARPLSNLVRADIIEPVSGHGKGKYKFKR